MREINVKNYKFEGEGTFYYKNDNKYEDYVNALKIGRYIVTDINVAESYREYDGKIEG